MILKSNLEVTQAVLVCDNFNDEFQPIQSDQTMALLKIVNCPVVEYSLTFLKTSGIEQVVIFSSNAKKLRDYLELRKWFKKTDELPFVIVRSSDNLSSLGDVMREVYNNNLIKNDFILLSGNVIGSRIPLNQLLKEHIVKRTNDDKGLIMTMLFTKLDINHRSRSKRKETLLVLNKQTQKLLSYESIDKNNPKKKINLDLELFQRNSSLEMHFDLQDTHIAICSFVLPSLFQDNCDYNTKDDLIYSVLAQEEIMMNTIYVKTIDEGSYSIKVNDAFSFDSVSRDIVQRWSFPTVPDVQEDQAYHRHNVYKSSTADLKIDSVLEQNVVIGKHTSIDSGCRIRESVIGENCKIGTNVNLDGCYIMDNVVIESDCSFNQCILSNNVVIKKGSNLKAGCILGANCIVGPNVTLEPCTLLQDKCEFGDGKVDVKLVGKEGKAYLYEYEDDDDDDEDRKELKLIWGASADDQIDNYSDDSQSLNSETDDNELIEDEEEADEYEKFFKEVLDSLTRGHKDNIRCENLILEINGSKHAYNIPFKCLISLIVKAILHLPKSMGLNEDDYIKNLDILFKKFLPILKNYVKSNESQIDCLLSLEFLTLDQTNDRKVNALVRIINFLYDNDVLKEETILKWFKTNLDFPDVLSERDSNQVDTKKDNQRKELKSNNSLKMFVKWLEEAEEESD